MILIKLDIFRLNLGYECLYSTRQFLAREGPKFVYNQIFVFPRVLTQSMNKKNQLVSVEQMQWSSLCFDKRAVPETRHTVFSWPGFNQNRLGSYAEIQIVFEIVQSNQLNLKLLKMYTLCIILNPLFRVDYILKCLCTYVGIATTQFLLYHRTFAE